MRKRQFKKNLKKQGMWELFQKVKAMNLSWKKYIKTLQKQITNSRVNMTKALANFRLK